MYAGWSGPNVQSIGDSAFYNTTVPGAYTLGVHRTYKAPDPNNANETIQQTDSIVVKVVVKPGTGVPDIKDALAALVREVFTEKQESVTDSLVALRGDSAEVVDEVEQFAMVINSRESFDVFEGGGSGEYSQTIHSDEADIYVLSADELNKLKQVDKYKKWMDATRTMNNKRIAIWKQLEIERFLLSIINDPNAFNVFLDNLILNSGRLLAVFILNNPTNENRLKAKEIIVDYINAQIENSISY